MALTSGFGDLSHFNRSLRRRFGMTPREARAESAVCPHLRNV
ncbi:helix-turn-helix domain-containing protein [Ottowia sp. GY511]|uniref:AraC family transcriptional regulator n=1 Tax=Ottowia flava TaxID=2675430 RepID=A0ABW4KTP8_9BURK|nr:AraC family transcriptional regulator [Ottowia sp. GY511]TXK33589.1 helix-turn-helix domain-containing protein [Ottowia sp. GY511]